jgi:hypothetical protein
MKTVVAFIFALPFSAFALQIGDCMTADQLDASLKQKGQHTLIVASDWNGSANSEVRVTIGENREGFFVRGANPGRLCIVAGLVAVSLADTKARATFDLCEKKALPICNKIKTGFKQQPLTTSVTAITSEVLIGMEVGKGLSSVEFGFCFKPKTGSITLCAMTQTAASVIR